MGVTRKLPRTDEERTVAINKAKRELGIVIPAEVTLTLATKTRLNALFISWKNANDTIQTDEYNKTTATSLVESTKITASLFIRHFIMVFNMGVERDVYTAEQRAFFYIDINSDALPPITTEEDIILWGNRIVDGDGRRVTAGGAAMANPTAAEVSTALTAFVNANNDQEVKTAAWKASLLVRTNLRTEADAVILKVWDESETFYNELPAPTKRDKCRPWGVVYVSDVEVTINLEVVKDADGTPIGGASTHFVEGDTTHISTADGVEQIKTTVADLATLVTNHPGFVENTVVVNFTTGVTVYNVTVRMVGV